MVTQLNHQWLDYPRLCLLPLTMDSDDDITSDLEAELEPDVFKQFAIDFHVWQQRLVMLLSIVLTQIINSLTTLFDKPPCIPHHTSILTGKAWIIELMNGHPDRIKINLGVSLDTFSALVQVLEQNGITESQNGVSGMVYQLKSNWEYTSIPAWLVSHLVLLVSDSSGQLIPSQSKCYIVSHLMVFDFLPDTSSIFYTFLRPQNSTTHKCVFQQTGLW